MAAGIRHIIMCLLMVAGSILPLEAWQGAENVPLATTEEIRLAPPKVVADSLIYRQKARVLAVSGFAEGSIQYRSKTSEAGQVMTFDGLLELEQSCQLDFWTEHPAYQSSDTVTIEVVRISQTAPQFSIKLETEPHENYSGSGAPGLSDMRKGSTNFRVGEHWLGFQDPVVRIALEFNEATEVSNLRLGLLQDSNSWILLPREILVESEGKEIGKLLIPAAEPEVKTASLFRAIPVQTGNYKSLLIKVKPQVLPQWHQGAGSSAWVFIDEILIESP